MSYVLLISLGPIQEFIASARRCQDLWFGSWLLSELSLAAAKAIAAHPAGGDDALVFPGGLVRRALDGREGAEVANKIVARIDGGRDEVRAVAAAARAAMEARRDELTDLAFERAGRGDPLRDEHFHRDPARAQVEDLIEFLWVATRVDGDDGYRAARREAERLLAARKNTRRWSQPTRWAAPVPKSSLDGVRESVLDEALYPRPGRRPTIGDGARRRLYGVDGAERLCGVSLLKRLGRRDTDGDGGPRRRFYSSSHLAALPWMLALESRQAAEPDVIRAWTAYCEALERLPGRVLAAADVAPFAEGWLFGNIDGQVLFEQRLVEAFEEAGVDQPEVHREALGALRAFRERVGLRGDPQPYYAILHADGDRMGTVIDHHDHADHVRISKALTGFARDVQGIVRAHRGSLVYSGGDDVLALLPLHRAVACAEKLAARFAQGLEGFTDAEGRRPTLSVGLGMVHHLTPFDRALDVARRAEKLAKRERDSLAIIVDKRGGAEVQVAGPWRPFARRLRQLVALRRLEAIPGKAGHELAELARITEGVPETEREIFARIARSEASRVLSRKREGGGGHAVEERVRAAVEAMVPGEVGNAAAWLGEALVVAGELARVEEEAGEGEVPKPGSVEEVLG